MSRLNNTETLYELLRVGPKASAVEITSAYHAAKNAFSKDSIATYSLMSAEDNSALLAQLETAYMTLINPDRRRAYDQSLAPGSPTNIDEITSQPVVLSAEPSPLPQTEPLTAGELNLLQLREKMGLTLNDVYRITKIPPRYLKAIEDFDQKNLPAQVYVQGFLKNLAQLYRLDPKSTVSRYMEQLNYKSGPAEP